MDRQMKFRAIQARRALTRVSEEGQITESTKQDLKFGIEHGLFGLEAIDAFRINMPARKKEQELLFMMSQA